MFKQQIIDLLSDKTRMRKEEIEKLIEIPPNSKLGDYAFPCFVLSKKEKKAPDKIAEKFSAELSKKLPKGFEKIKPAGPYLNFFVDKKELAKQMIKINGNFGRAGLGKNKNIVIDFSAPNIGKPMHIGHIRSTVIGDSMMRIYDFLGYNPIGINYLGDTGLHIGKLLVAYQLWINRQALKKDPIQEMLRLYVKFCEKENSKFEEGLEEEFQNNEWTKKAKEKLKELELGNKTVKKIWDEIRKYSGKGFDKVYDILNVNFNETVGQSQFEQKGKEIVINALERQIAHREKDGAVYVELPSGKKYIQRSNETASYITYDLGAAVERAEHYKPEKMIYVTDFRQKQHFESLFALLKLMDYGFADKMVHLPFGIVKFGKEIIASRKGNIILLKDVLIKAIDKAGKEIKKRKTKGDPEKVGAGAIKYIILKNEPIKGVQFSWDSALSFEGNTGPYLQYSYARASSIIKKAENFNKSIKKIPELNSYEIELIKKISQFPEVVERAGNSMNPSLIANYSFELAQLFNEFYHSCKVIGDSNEGFRLRLVDSFRTCLKNALHLLGIDVMEEM